MLRSSFAAFMVCYTNLFVFFLKGYAMPISNSPTTQDAKSLIILNYNQSTTEQYRINDTEFVFDAPTVNPDAAFSYNTRLYVRPIATSGKYGRITIYYDRINLSALIGHRTAGLEAASMEERVAYLCDWYGITLTPEDYVASGEGIDLLLTAQPQSLMFVGVLQFKTVAPIARPVNDNFLNAIALVIDAEHATGTITGNNTNATVETNEPTLDTNGESFTSLSSIWYKFTAAVTGPIVLDTAGSTPDTVLKVYTLAQGESEQLGSEGQLPVLDLVAFNDEDELLGNVSTSRVNFDATSGTTYYVCVDQYFDAGDPEYGDVDYGPILLNWSQGLPMATAGSWVQAVMPLSVEHAAVATYNTVSVSVDSRGDAWRSEDGQTWQPIAQLSGQNFESVGVDENGMWMLKSYNSLLISTDGLSWTVQSNDLPIGFQTQSVCHLATGGGLWLILTHDTPDRHYYTSVDRVTWTQRVMPAVDGVRWMSMADNGFVLVAVGGSTVGDNRTTTYAKSEDGLVWQLGELPVGGDYRKVVGNLTWFVAQAEDMLLYSATGANWTALGEPSGNFDFRGITLIRDRAVLMTEGMYEYATTDFVAYQKTIAIYSDSWADLTFADDNFLVTSFDPIFAYGQNGLDWQIGSIPNTVPRNTLTKGNGLFACLGGESGLRDTVYTSPDGSGWTAATALLDTSVNQFWTSLVFGNGVWLAMSNNGDTATSADLTVWQYGEMGVEETYTLVHSNGRFIAVTVIGGAQAVAWSIDGLVWEAYVDNAQIGGIARLAYTGTEFVMIGENGDVATSETCATWTVSALPDGQTLVYAGFDDGQLVLAVDSVDATIGLGYVERSALVDDTAWVDLPIGITENIRYAAFGLGIHVALCGAETA